METTLGLEKVAMRKNGELKDGTYGEGSGRLQNPDKRILLMLSPESIREFIYMNDKNGLSYDRKAIITTGMSLGSNGSWCGSHLTQERP